MRLPALTVLLLLAVAAPASAGGSGVSILFDSPPVEALEADVRVSGEVEVTFGGDPATCASFGRCGEQGTIVYRPNTRQTLSLFAFRTGGKRTLEGALYPRGTYDREVFTQVRRPRAGGGSGVCGDSRRSLSGLTATVADGRVTIGIPVESLGPLETACGGPLWSDVRAAMPVARVRVATLRRAGISGDLRNTGTFTEAGLTGTLRSTVRVRTTRLRPARTGDDEEEEDETAYTRWRVASVSGGVRIDERHAATAPGCDLLDACGLHTALALSPRPRVRDSDVTLADPPSGGLAGAGGWTETGTVAATVTRPGGAAPCTDVAPLATGFLMLGTVPGGLRVAYSPVGVRSRCGGGPSVEESFLTTAAYGTFPRSVLSGSARRATLRLDRGVDRSRAGVRTTTTSDLVVELVRR